ncbi:uncharacterized protein LOC132199038 isoform X3 [Neocloeon triangulifer]|uniref:uncharacterized protein LOC132199038 isoform X3 n=1 Tax=Neocloeon triangulifer TaxID=2078957 RepID=UPI00286EEC22|nr:uncharacterized protein LOC132199038 isoform X3 [Neocloeon triangulifer]
MLVLALCLMTKILEYSSGRVLCVQDDPATQGPNKQGSKRLPCRRRARRTKTQQTKTEETCDNRIKEGREHQDGDHFRRTGGLEEKMGDPNCNNRGWCGEGWPRKGLLSTFSMSTYNDLARDLDANLAQIDMDDDLDMHSVLTTVNHYSDSQSDASSKESVCRSGPLFSPVKDSPLTNLTNISVDSLDLEGDILLTCQANKDNYTIAFEDYSTAGEDSWCGSRKLFDVCSSSSDEGLGAGPGAPLSLVRRLFLKQQQRSEERMSTSSSSELDSSSRFCPANINALLNKTRKCPLQVTQATQTEAQSLNQSVQTRAPSQPPPTTSRPHLQVCYPNYALPDLSFLKTAGTPPGATVHLAPRGPPIKAGKPSGRPRPFSLDDVERLKDKGLSHVKDWDSLNVLLPAECRQILEASSSSSGYHSPGTQKLRKKGSKDELNNNPRWDQPTSEDVLRLRAQVSSQLLKTMQVQFAPPNSPCHPPKDDIPESIAQHRIPFSLPLNLDLSRVSGLGTFADMVSTMRVACQQYCSCLSDPDTLQTVALQQICPALTDILSHGLRPEVDTGFGMVSNSAWRVVEAAAHSGQIAKALNDLLMRVNADDMLTEGPLKVNAFIFGLINVGALGAWLSLLRTRESLIRKHYGSIAFLAGANSSARQHFDAVVAAVESLPRPPAPLDLLLEVKRLQRGLRPLLSRPRSCVHENLSLQLGQLGPEERKQRRWSATASPKLAQALERLVAEEAARAEASSEGPSEADSLETRDRFKKLQRQWELMSRPSRIPRLINSPSRPMAPSWPPAHTPSPPRPVEMRNKPLKAPPPTLPKPKAVKPQPAPKKPITTRGQPLRRVQTVRHRLGAESGHLSYDKGQTLEVLVCVDSRWLLCAKGVLKGLVPREDVM